MGNRDVGWYDNSLGTFTGFKMRMICAIFHSAAKYQLSRTALNNYKVFYPNNKNFLRILPVMRS
jgi:hypothetical protein